MTSSIHTLASDATPPFAVPLCISIIEQIVPHNPNYTVQTGSPINLTTQIAQSVLVTGILQNALTHSCTMPTHNGKCSIVHRMHTEFPVCVCVFVCMCVCVCPCTQACGMHVHACVCLLSLPIHSADCHSWPYYI